MKKIGIIVLLIFIVGLGVLTAIYYNQNRMVGTYKTTTWNGKDGVLVINRDKTCIHPSGNNGTWYVESNILYLELESGTKQEAKIVDKGIMLGTHFFEKL